MAKLLEKRQFELKNEVSLPGLKLEPNYANCKDQSEMTE